MNTTDKTISKDYIFSQNKDGDLIFEGRFDEYYQDDLDPWQQSGNGDMKAFYHESRNRVCSWFERGDIDILEVGCGLGYALQHFSTCFDGNYTGMDISVSAISRAKQMFPQFKFIAGDICKKITTDEQANFDVIILNQLLWYILEDLDTVMENVSSLLRKNGKLIVCNAFARKQKYGNDIINGFHGASEYFCKPRFELNMAHCAFYDQGFRNNDGIFVLFKNPPELHQTKNK